MNFALGAVVFGLGVIAGVSISQGNLQKILDNATDEQIRPSSN